MLCLHNFSQQHFSKSVIINNKIWYFTFHRIQSKVTLLLCQIARFNIHLQWHAVSIRSALVHRRVIQQVVVMSTWTELDTAARHFQTSYQVVEYSHHSSNVDAKTVTSFGRSQKIAVSIRQHFGRIDIYCNASTAPFESTSILYESFFKPLHCTGICSSMLLKTKNLYSRPFTIGRELPSEANFQHPRPFIGASRYSH